jgi:hypothetical protein
MEHRGDPIPQGKGHGDTDECDDLRRWTDTEKGLQIRLQSDLESQQHHADFFQERQRLGWMDESQETWPHEHAGE